MAANPFDSRFSDRITIFECSLSIFGYPKSTEHPHKLPNLIVKELPETFFRERPLILNDPQLVSRSFSTFFTLAGAVGPFESAYSTARLVIVNN
jgi:hypothetical protein